MKSPQQLEQEIVTLRSTGMELYQRAENWRKALEEIQGINRDPVVSLILKRNLNS